jgi:hypothetical protein
MMTGSTLQSVGQRIAGDLAHKRDFIVPTHAMRVVVEGGRPALTFKVSGAEQLFVPNNLCLRQMGSRTQIPANYVDRMIAEAPELVAVNFNHWFEAKSEKRMLRTLDNGSKVARAFLSDVYRPLDNADIVENILPKLERVGAKITSCEVTEQRLYLQATIEQLTGQVTGSRMNDTRGMQVGDVVRAGIVISNSEVGCGALRIEQLLERLACLNGMIVADRFGARHVGKANGGDGDDATVYSRDTLKATDRAFWMRISDQVDAAVDRGKFDSYVAKLTAATAKELPGDPNAVMEVVTKRFGLDDNESGSVLKSLCQNGEFTSYGLMNAITATANQSESYDRGIELERFGGQVIELPANTWAN